MKKRNIKGDCKAAVLPRHQEKKKTDKTKKRKCESDYIGKSITKIVKYIQEVPQSQIEVNARYG